jgi:hypothetical protein
MSKTYFSPSGKACVVEKIYIGDPATSVARVVQKAYIGDSNNKAQLVFVFAPWYYSDPILQSTNTGQTGSISGYSDFQFDDQTGYFTLLGSKSTYNLANLYVNGNYVYTGAYHATGLHYMTLQKVVDKASVPTYTYDVWTMATKTGEDNLRYEENDIVTGYTSITKGGNASGPTFNLSGAFNTEFFEQFGDEGGTYYTKSSSEAGYREYTVTYNPSNWSYTQSYVYHYPVKSSTTFATRQSTGWNTNKSVYTANETVGSQTTYTVNTYKIEAVENQ